MFHHIHPYPPYIPAGTTKLIVGTLPPPRFTLGILKDRDVDFCYGSRDGQLWPILDKLFNLNLLFENSEQAIQQRKAFLKSRNIGICDIVASAKRNIIDASDKGMEHSELRNIITILQKHPNVDTLLFTGGNSKNGPEYFFRKLLKQKDINLNVISNVVPRVHTFNLKAINEEQVRTIKTISLIAPSGAANRAVGSLEAYKKMKLNFPEKNTIDFRIAQYAPFF